jgi:hypothetical protein
MVFGRIAAACRAKMRAKPQPTSERLVSSAVAPMR